MRYPIFIKEMLDSPSLTQAQKDRIGFHNDCFLADYNDMGTYDNNSWMGWFDIEVKKQWMYDRMTSTGFNTITGGETCNSDGYNDAAGVNVQSEMSKLNFTEINEDYAAVNTSKWKATNLAASGNDPAETAFVRLKRKMGYRLRLVNANFSDSVQPGGQLTFSASISNDGWAGPVKQRPVFLTAGQRHPALRPRRPRPRPAPVDARRALPGRADGDRAVERGARHLPAGSVAARPGHRAARAAGVLDQVRQHGDLEPGGW